MRRTYIGAEGKIRQMGGSKWVKQTERCVAPLRGTYPCARALFLGVPLLAVQTHLDALADEETRPHDDVVRGALPLVVHGNVEHH